MTAHEHTAFAAGCYRCELSRDEVAHQMRTDRAAEAIHQRLCGCSRDHAVAHDDDSYYEAAERGLIAAAEFDRAGQDGAA